MTYPRKIPTFFWEFPGHTPPEFDLAAYRLNVGGAVQHPMELTLQELHELLPRITAKRRFFCVNGWSLEAEWGGYRVSDLLDMVRPTPTAEFLRATSLGGYEDTSPIAGLIDGGAMLVTHMDGDPLPPKRGRPMRLMVFDRYQFKGVKALGTLEVVQEYRAGTWQKYGYHDASIQPYPHLAIDKNEDLMPPAEVLGIS